MSGWYHSYTALVRASDIAQFDIDTLQLCVVLDRGGAVLPTQTRPFVAAERHLDWGDAAVVDPAGAGLQTGDDPMAAGEIAGEHAGGQAEIGGIGPGHQLLFALARPHRHDLTENFLAHDAHRIAAGGEHRGAHEPAALASRH